MAGRAFKQGFSRVVIYQYYRFVLKQHATRLPAEVNLFTANNRGAEN